MYQRILVATDGSEHGNAAVMAACKLAAALGCSLGIVHVMGHGDVPDSIKHYIDVEHMAESPKFEVHDVTNAGTGIAYLRSIAETGIRRYQMWSALAKKVVGDAEKVAKTHAVKDVSTSIEEGDPVDALMSKIEGLNPGLVVMGRRGVSDLGGLLMGSVSHKICQLADCDVLTVKSA